jgi:L-alanine-DL-glutamate epimerase-like enolase superfamily enzyme
VDANGAFSPEQAKIVLQELAALDIHSIEQPIKAGDWESNGGTL